MELKFDFIEITFSQANDEQIGPFTEKEFYEWIRRNSKEDIGSISSLKYKIDGENYYFRIERSKIPILNKWDAVNIFSKTDSQSLNFTFDWLRGLDFRIHFERKLREGLAENVEQTICVCKQQNIIKEMGLKNAAL
jgi:hypothetical protein